MQILLSIKSEKQCTQSYADLERKCHLICLVGQLVNQEVQNRLVFQNLYEGLAPTQVNKAKLNYHRNQ